MATGLRPPKSCRYAYNQFQLHQPHLFATFTTMALDAARDLSVPELLLVLNEKLKPECIRPQKTRPSTTEMDSEVSTRRPASVSTNLVAGSDVQPSSSKPSKLGHAIS